MDIEKLISKILKQKGEVKVADIVKVTGFSRAYVNKIFKKLRGNGRVVLIGKANQARYVTIDKNALIKAKRNITNFQRTFINRGLSEDQVLDDIKRTSGIFVGSPKNVESILDYAFTEILNNAIEHSGSRIITVKMKRIADKEIIFSIIDNGVGIYHHIMKKEKLKNELAAIQDLTKGKLTTASSAHTGEGIFFTSKAADIMMIESGTKNLIFNNTMDDVFVEDIKHYKGTKVIFIITLNSKRNLSEIFKQYSGDSFEFDKTRVVVKLYKIDTQYISRSQGRRVVSSLDKFKTVVLDFKNVEIVGQAFVDEVFRVWQKQHPRIKFITKNANENINFMIKRALG